MKRVFRNLFWGIRGRRALERRTRHRAGQSTSNFGGDAPFPDLSGSTIYGNVALRLKSLSVEELDASRDDPGAAPDAFKVRLARSPKTVRDAGVMVKQRYAWRGLEAKSLGSDPNLVTFLAYDEGDMVGTVGIRLDSPDGLAADVLYGDEVNALRDKHYKVCEFTRLAINTSHASKPVIAALFHTAYLFAYKLRGHDYSVIEVNPRHVGYYRRALGFELLGPERHNRRVDAPAVLLGTPFERIAENLHRYAGRSGSHGKSQSLFVHGFSPEEEKGILARLRALEPRAVEGIPVYQPH